MQTSAQNTAANLFTSAESHPTPICVTAFIPPQALIGLSMYADSSKDNDNEPMLITVGYYMSDRTISRVCNFTNAANALNYAFLLKGEKCPISKPAFALLKAEIKRTGAVSTRAKARAEAKAREDAEAEVREEAEVKESVQEVRKEDEPKSVATTPLMKQYEEMKEKHPDAILLFRVGDFYEVFDEDAKTASEILGITLTARANGKNGKVYLAGFPHHALDTYLPRLVRAGKRVAICEQLEEPKAKVIKRKKKA